MKASKYNYTTEYKEGVIFLNGITEASFKVKAENAPIYQTIIENPDVNYDSFKSFIDRLKTQGFIIDDDVNEAELITQKYAALRAPHEYRLMLLPTYACNLRCWYCVQDHKDEWLTSKQYDAVEKLVERKLVSEEIKNFHLSWFGGEPLMAYDALLKFTLRMKTLCERLGKHFSCGITTNATLLTPERIEALRAAGVTFYQITIDGDREGHDRVKVLGQISAFDRTMENIAHLARHTLCTLRYNYSPATLKPESIMSDVLARLPEDVRGNISMNLQPVWQDTFTSEGFEKVEKMMEIAKDNKLRCSHKTGGLCYVDFDHFDCIYPSGEIGKCENDIKDMRKGRINPDGTTDFEDADTAHYSFNPLEDESDCKECQYLPLCWGPCSQKRYIFLKETNKIKCMYKDRKNNIGEFIRNIHLSHVGAE